MRHHFPVTRWPASADEIPSPGLVAALAKLGIAPTERIPLWAAHWLVAGYDGEHVVHLAGLHGDDPHEVRDSLPAALEECGVILPDSDVAAATVAFTRFARMHVDGLAGALWIAQKVDEVLCRSDFADGIVTLPLGQLFGITDEWGAGWGHTDEQLAEVVRNACEEQLRA